ncbi:MAG: class I SAM-dependent RNA methyltransferase, partial [Aquiluna sp.]
RVTSVESDTESSRYAAKNLEDVAGVESVDAETLKFLRAVSNDPLELGVVVLDPPRSGANKEIVELIAAKNPAGIVYVACDPVALSRDLAYFAERGYEPTEIKGLDLFPHTHHMEAVATLRPAG